MSSINDKLNKDTEDTNPKTGLEFFKFLEGNNKVRVLTEGEVITQHFFGKGIRPSVCYGISKGCPFHKDEDKAPSVKYSCYILDYTDNKVKLADLPYSVIKKVGDLQENTDWAFDSFPMPYDITVNYKPAESPANMYSVIGSPKQESVSEEVLSTLAELVKTANPGKLIESKKAKQLEEHKASGLWKPFESGLSEDEKARIRKARGEDKVIQVDEDAQGDAIKGAEIPW